MLLALHRQGSFLGAGRALGMSTSTASRRIEALEAALGRVLVRRSSSGTALEAEALGLVRLAEEMELGLRAVRRDRAEDALSGTVRVSTAGSATRGVTQRLCELRRRHPGLTFEILDETRLVDLARREADIAMRSVKVQSEVVAHRAVGRAHFGLYAGAHYVERRLSKTRVKVSDFGRHDFVGYEEALAKTPKNAWLTERGVTRFVFQSNTDHALVEAIAQGQGLGLLSVGLAREHAGLMRVEVDAELPSVPVYLAYHRELRDVPRIRLVLETLAAALQEALRG
ncbi:transcriptional regulator, LysR family [Chondromyces apiculatus DSM 436]|uniref:Transcriptional regulator, LysR family n=1 Tax=Chondromyces apiculatus DSM 436 TaxID=1192034 RepID=A0A017T1X0_9BACT|nr:transcriptional regulator, LysR family [Chondromyces apiculatus DSM 436]